MLDKIKRTIQKYEMFGKKDKIVVGVSGGPDSLALLLSLNSLKKEFNLNLHVAHLDHMIRERSYRDSEFVARIAKKLNLTVTCGKINLSKKLKKGSWEEIARNARFHFLFKVARQQKTDKICLGHNFDDQAETVLMRILRGTGLSGLAGILPKRKIQGFMILRPLIEVSRKEINSFLNRKGIKPRIDITNSQDIFLRNKVRNKLLPLLEKEYNRNIKQVLNNIAKTASFDYAYLLAAADKIIKRRNGKVGLESFKQMHPAIQRMVLRSQISHLKGDTRSIELRHIEEIEDLILNRPVNSVVDLPKGVSVVKKSKSLCFYRKNTAKTINCK